MILQSLSTLSPPRRFGQPPDSRKITWASFLWVSFGQPAFVANSGSQVMSPWVNTISRVVVVVERSISEIFCQRCSADELFSIFVGAFTWYEDVGTPKAKKSKEVTHPAKILNCDSWCRLIGQQAFSKWLAYVFMSNSIISKQNLEHNIAPVSFIYKGFPCFAN